MTARAGLARASNSNRAKRWHLLHTQLDGRVAMENVIAGVIAGYPLVERLFLQAPCGLHFLPSGGELNGQCGPAKIELVRGVTEAVAAHQLGQNIFEAL